MPRVQDHRKKFVQRAAIRPDNPSNMMTMLLAILLICAGLGCLGYVAFSLLQNRPAAPAASAPVAYAPPPDPRPTAAPAATAPLAGSGALADQPAPAPSFEPEPAPAGRNADARTHEELSELRSRLQQIDPTRSGSAPRAPRPRSEHLRRIDPDALNETLRVYEQSERRQPEPAPQLIVSGMLYLDHARRIPTQLDRRGEIPTRIFSGLRRIGTGTLILEDTSFLIHCGNASYAFSAGDLDQILFQSSGVALVPIHPDRPIPVFLTREVERVKHCIKKNARIRAL